ncbi:Importin N-terminal domain-containing protein [Candida albicans]
MSQNNLETIPKILEQSLHPQFSNQADKILKSIENEPGFSINLLHVIASTNLSQSIRLAGALYFKNLIKRKWLDGDGDGNNYLLPIDDVNKIKLEIIDIMIQLPNQLQVQIGEAITLIAESDFPHNWPNLIENLVTKFSLTNFINNKAILLVSHSIFKKWRALFRSDELFLEIKLVLTKFVDPFLKLFIELDQLIDKSSDNEAQLIIYFENLLLLVQIYYDFNCQDIPEFFEDHMNELMAIIHKYLVYENGLLKYHDNDEEVNVLIKVKTSIVELLSLYITRYADVFQPLIQTFITSVWELINNYVTKQPKYDLLVVKSLQFLTSIIKIPDYQSLFQQESSINEIIEKIILPNIYFRENDEETFEDEPILYVRSDLEGSDYDSRRKSATDFLRELKELNSELLTTTVMKYVNQFLNQSTNHNDWRNKDTAIYLFSSLATKGSVTNIGVTSTNVLVDVVKFFSDNIANDLATTTTTTTTTNTGATSVHPILQVDAIKYIYIFRNQLTKEQLMMTLPRLIDHLDIKSNPVVYTYSAITIEKLLSMTNFNQDHTPIFNKTDIQPYINELLTNLFNLICINNNNNNNNNNSSPEKLAENEFLIKCIMRILNTGEDSLNENNRFPIINQLLTILKLTAKNPSNPKFSHYIFESLGLLIKYGINDNDNDNNAANQYIEIIIPALLDILSEDVQEFVPYTFQILAFLLEKYPKQQGLPETYKNLIQPLLSPSVWQFRGNIPGITRLLIAILEHDPNSTFINGGEKTLTPLLGVFQNLLASKINDGYGFDLIQSIMLNIPIQPSLQSFLPNIARLMLTRLQKSRTDKYVKRFVTFLCLLSTISLQGTTTTTTTTTTNVNKDILNGEFVIQFLESVQSGLFQQILTSFILPTSSILTNLQDKKLVNIGLSQILVTISTTSEQYAHLTPLILETLISNLNSYEGISKSSANNNNNGISSSSSTIATSTISGGQQPLNELDLDLDLNFNFNSFGSQYSKIVSIQNSPFDPLNNLIKNNDFNNIKLIIFNNIKKIDIKYLYGLNSTNQEILKKLGF